MILEATIHFANSATKKFSPTRQPTKATGQGLAFPPKVKSNRLLVLRIFSVGPMF